MADELVWDPPGDGIWWLVREHLPRPTGAMYATLLPPVTSGWERGRARYGVPHGPSRWVPVNGWWYVSPGEPDLSRLAQLEENARRTLEERAWRDEVRRWIADERPRVVAQNLGLQQVDLSALDDDAVLAHLHEAIDHFLAVAPLHFEHVGFDLAGGLLVQACAAWGIDAVEVIPLLAGASTGSSGPERHIERIFTAMLDAGAPAPTSLDDIRAANPETAAALTAFLDEHGWRLLEGCDLSEPTLGEQPEIVVRAVAARLEGATAGTPAVAGAVDPAVDEVRQRVPAEHRARFDEMLSDARAAYRLRDDDNGICFNWPLGLVRRAALELGRRLYSRGVVGDPVHLTEASPAEITALAAGEGPSSAALADRAERRRVAGRSTPPLVLGEAATSPGSPKLPMPEHVARLLAAQDALWSSGGAPPREALRGIGIGTEVRVGRAVVIDDPDALSRVEPGDVLVAVATTSAYNAIFPYVAAVATEEGGLLGHTAILSRELGVTAVVGVTDLMARVPDGATVEVDPVAGTVKVVELPGVVDLKLT